MKCINIILMVLLGSSLYCTSGFAQKIIAHRGASYLAPENTIAAVKLGYELGADAVEVDIHLSKDKRIMVNHDADTKRTAGGSELSIKNSNAEALRKLDVGSWKNEKYKREKIPFLEEVLAIVPEDKILVIEIKSGDEILPYLQQVIEGSGILDQLVIISFNKEAIIKAKKSMPSIPAYWLLHSFQEHSLADAIGIVKDNKLDGLDVHYKLVTPDFMQKMIGADLKVFVYTVNDPVIADKLLAMDVKGITTDRPKWLREQLAE